MISEAGEEPPGRARSKGGPVFSCKTFAVTSVMAP